MSARDLTTRERDAVLEAIHFRLMGELEAETPRASSLQRGALERARDKLQHTSAASAVAERHARRLLTLARAPYDNARSDARNALSETIALRMARALLRRRD